MAAETPALAAIEGYHDSIPVRNALDFGPSLASGPQSDIVTTAPVCFNGVGCEPQAPPPGSTDPGAGAPAEAPGADAPGQDVPAPVPLPGPPVPPTVTPPLENAQWTPDEVAAERSGACSSSRAAAALLAAAAAVAAAAPALMGGHW